MKNLSHHFKTDIWGAMGPQMAQHALTQVRRGTVWDKAHVGIRIQRDIQRDVATTVNGAPFDRYAVPGQNFMSPHYDPDRPKNNIRRVG